MKLLFDSVNQYWKDRNADIFDKNAYVSGRVKAIEKIAEIAECRLKPIGMNSVELGCGSGLFSEVSGIRNMTGIDFSQTLLDVAAQRMNHVLLESIFDLNMPRESIDNIISLFVLDDYPSDMKKRLFSDVFSFLKPGGHLFFAAYTKNDEGIKKFQQIIDYEVHVESEYLYRKLLTSLGFSIKVFDILNVQGNFNMDGINQSVQREYVLIEAIK